MQVNIWGASGIEKYFQGEGFTEKVTFKLHLKGGIDFVRQISCIVIIEKNSLSYTFCQVFCYTYLISLWYIVVIIITLWVSTIKIYVLETEKWPSLEFNNLWRFQPVTSQPRLLPTKTQPFLSVEVKYWTDTMVLENLASFYGPNKFTPQFSSLG